MPRKAAPLGPLAVSRLKVPGRYAVGEVAGLHLQVEVSGARYWVLRIMSGGKRRDMGLGGFPDVPLALAREKAREARELVDKGIDPVAARQASKSRLSVENAAAKTFKQAATAYIDAHEAGWKNAKHEQQWRNTLEKYAYPVMGGTLVRDVDMAQVLKVLEPIWREKTETASRLRGRIEKVLDWAKGRGYRKGDNPAAWKGNLDAQLPNPDKVAKVEHHAALAVSEVGGFMVRLRAGEGIGARALEFTILTAVRSGETRGATWAEIDLTAKVWTVPAERMKAGKEHRVPLSDAAVKVLKALPRGKPHEIVFMAPKGGQLSDMTLSAVLRRMKVPAVPHGFRSTFRDWASERTNYPNEVCEMALAHTIGDKVEAAYRRGDLFEKRARLMADWAKFCGTVLRAGGTVVPMRGAA
jgi:integrase